jgi:hypothetical protein
MKERHKLFCFECYGHKVFTRHLTDVLGMIECELFELEEEDGTLHFSVYVEYMTEEQYNNLPEFQGY